MTTWWNLTLNVEGTQLSLLRPTGVQILIGRSPSCDITLVSTNVSRQHVTLTVNPDGEIMIEDLSSASGVWLDAQKVNRAILPPNQNLIIGDRTIRALESPKLVPPPQMWRLGIELTRPSANRKTVRETLARWTRTIAPSQKVRLGHTPSSDLKLDPYLPDHHVAALVLQVDEQGRILASNDRGAREIWRSAGQPFENLVLSPHQSIEVGELDVWATAVPA